MKLGFIGLGRMGYNIVLNLIDHKHDVVVYNRSPEKVQQIAQEGAIASSSYEELASKLDTPRLIIISVTAGKPVDDVIDGLLPHLSKGDVIIESGNSWYEDSIRRHDALKKKGIQFLDMGTSGGLSGARNGACLTIGGEKKLFEKYENLFKDIATEKGYAYMGEVGSGHFVKMVHNGIEYALLQAYGEGAETLKKGPYKLDFEKVFSVWSHGSIIRSYLSEISVDAFKKDHDLKKFKGIIGGGETGTWTLKVAEKEGVEFGSLQHALEARKKSQEKQTFATKYVAAIRNEFGGHVEPK